MNEKYIKVDFHTHTIYSQDSLTSPARLVKAASKKNLDRIVVTDHNRLSGALIAKEINPEMVILGCEIETTKGEILAVFITEKIPTGLPPMEVITRLREQDAFISISHPFDSTRSGSWKTEDLIELIPFIDAIETFNARCLWPGFNWKAEKFARLHNILGTHGSDAHTPFEVGRGSLILPEFNDAASLRLNLLQAISPRLYLSPPWVHLYSRYASMVKKIKKST